MTDEDDRTAAWLDALDEALHQAARLANRDRASFERDEALPLAFEALSTHIGELAKRLTAADPMRFHEPLWTLAARHRDMVVHHYDRIVPEFLWATVTRSFPQLHELVREHRRVPPA